MKYIKQFERDKSGSHQQEVHYFVEHIIKFFQTDLSQGSVYYHEDYTKFTFWYSGFAKSKDDVYYNKVRHHLFNLNKIDYYHGDLDIWFEYIVDLNIKDWQLGKTLAKPNIPDDLLERVLFFYNVMKNTPKMIGYSQIPEFMEKITEEEFDFYQSTNKYNL